MVAYVEVTLTLHVHAGYNGWVAHHRGNQGAMSTANAGAFHSGLAAVLAAQCFGFVLRELLIRQPSDQPDGVGARRLHLDLGECLKL